MNHPSIHTLVEGWWKVGWILCFNAILKKGGRLVEGWVDTFLCESYFFTSGDYEVSYEFEYGFSVKGITDDGE
jgi:hypothetical protein